MNSNNITGTVLCPCGCGESINNNITEYKSNSLGLLFYVFIEKYREYLENRRRYIFEEKIIQEKIDNGGEITEQELLNFITPIL